MFWRITTKLARPFVRLWLVTANEGWARLPRPTGSPHASAPGEDPLRILLVGNGAAVGYGVLLHELALAGRLAVQLATVFDRGVFVDVVPDGGMTARRCLDELSQRNLFRYDAIVTTIGVNEALGLMSTAEWASAVELIAQRPAPIYMVAIPPMQAIREFPWLVRVLADRHARILNKLTADACERHHSATFVPFAPRNNADRARYRSWQTYDAWAKLIVPWMYERMFSRPDRIRSLASADEGRRQRALDELGILDTPREARFDRILTATQELFGAFGAMLGFIDRDRQWFKSAAGFETPEIIRSSAFCDITIRSTDVLVIENTLTDPIFRLNPFVTGDPNVRFYAGYAIEAPGGERIGALCIIDTEPRKFSSADSSLLRELALEVQNEVWATRLDSVG